MLKKGLRLRKKEDFNRVFRSGKPLFFNDVGCRYLASTHSLRLGFSFSKKHIPLATRRNRLRRVLSEAFSKLKDIWPEGGDIVFFTLRKPKKIDIQDSHTIVKSLLNQITSGQKKQ